MLPAILSGRYVRLDSESDVTGEGTECKVYKRIMSVARKYMRESH